VGRKLWQWIKNWLSGRTQQVILNGEASEWIEVLSGVPQDSVLGLLLFLIFINDKDMDATDIDVLIKFTDDTKVGQAAQSEDDRRALQTALNNLCDWTEKWGMCFNVSKCSHVFWKSES
jgi:hypothetical protein